MIKKLSSQEAASAFLGIAIAVFVAVLCIFVLSSKLPEISFFQSSLTSLENSNTTVMELAGATMASSVAISAMPGDFATPLANTLADMDMYFVFLLVVIFVERLLITQGIRLTLTWLIPAACAFFIGGTLLTNETFKSLAKKLFVFGVAIILVVPCSTKLADTACSDYLGYVEDTIVETNAGADKINEAMSDSVGEKTIFDKLSDAFQTAMDGITDLLQYFKNIIKKCMTSIAILMITSFLMPIAAFLFLGWLFKEIFSLNISNTALKNLMLKASSATARKNTVEVSDDE